MAAANDSTLSQSASSGTGTVGSESARADGRNNSGDSGTSSGTAGAAASTSTNSGTSGASGTGSGTADGAGGNANNAGGRSDDSGTAGAGSIPIGTAFGGRVEELTDDANTRTRGRRTRSNRARSGGAGTADTGSTREETRDASQVVSRVASPRKTKAEAEAEADFSIPGNAKELIGDLYGLVYWLASQITNDPVWKLRDDEMTLMGDKTYGFVTSLGKRRATNLMKSLGKVGPAIALVSTAAVITAPRVRSTLNKKKVVQRESARPIREVRTEAGAASTTDRVAPEVDQHSGPGGNTDTGLSERSFSSRDFEDFGVEDVE